MNYPADTVDPERALALAYAAPAARAGLAALWRLDETLGSIVARTDNPAVGQMRLTWWHDALASLRTVRPVDPVLAALAETEAIEPEALLPLIDGWEALLDPLPLSDAALDVFARERGATLFRAAGAVLGRADPRLADAGRLWALVDLAFRVSDPTTAERALALAPRVAGRWRRALRPIAILSALAAHDARRGIDRARQQGSPGRVLRAALAGMTGL